MEQCFNSRPSGNTDSSRYIFTVTPITKAPLSNIKPQSGEVRYFTGLQTTTELLPVTVEDFELVKADGDFKKAVLFGEYEKVDGVKRVYECEANAGHVVSYVVELWKHRARAIKVCLFSLLESLSHAA